MSPLDIVDRIEALIVPEHLGAWQQIRLELINDLIAGDNARLELKDAEAELREVQQWANERPNRL